MTDKTKKERTMSFKCSCRCGECGNESKFEFTGDDPGDFLEYLRLTTRDLTIASCFSPSWIPEIL